MKTFVFYRPDTDGIFSAAILKCLFNRETEMTIVGIQDHEDFVKNGFESQIGVMDNVFMVGFCLKPYMMVRLGMQCEKLVWFENYKSNIEEYQRYVCNNIICNNPNFVFDETSSLCDMVKNKFIARENILQDEISNYLDTMKRANIGFMVVDETVSSFDMGFVAKGILPTDKKLCAYIKKNVFGKELDESEEVLDIKPILEIGSVVHRYVERTFTYMAMKCLSLQYVCQDFGCL